MTGQRHPSSPRAGVTTVGQVAAAFDPAMLTLACDCCMREGRLSMARLLTEWGQHAALADVADELSADCPKQGTYDIYSRCDPHWPDLPGLLMPGAG